MLLLPLCLGFLAVRKRYVTSTTSSLGPPFSGSGNHSSGIREGLLSRGWVENPEHNSNIFDLKWSIKNSEIDHSALWTGQMVNHFDDAACITTKIGLCMRLRQLQWFESADYRKFYPRAYALHELTDKQAFLQV